MMHQRLLACLGLVWIAMTLPASSAAPEEAYLTGRIVEDLRRMCEFAATKKVDWKQPARALPQVDDVWKPKSYRTFLKEHLPNPRKDAATPDAAFALNLLDPTGPGMALASNDLSARLTAKPTSPELHEAAALLLCTLALREQSGRFYDVRLVLCRITAHLAFARHLSDTPSANGQLAAAILEALKGNAKTAHVMASQLPAVAGDWKEIVDLAVTGDWRNVPRKPSMLFTFLRTEALLSASDGELSRREVDRLADMEETLRNRTDWHRIFLEDPPTRKYALNQLGRANRLEGAEMAAVMSALKLNAPTRDDLIALLNTRAGYAVMPDPVGLPRVAVLDWGLWAEHYQRHICHLLTFFPAIHALERQFAGLDLLPFVMLQQRKRPNGIDRSDVVRAIGLCVDSPERINLVNWRHTQRLLEAAATDGPDPFMPLHYSPHASASIRKRPALGFVPAAKDVLKRLPDPMTWFAPVPAGSHYRAAYRFDVIDDATRAAAATENPWDPALITWRLRDGDQAFRALKELDKLVGDRAQYDLNVMTAMRQSLGTDVTGDLLRRMAKMSPRAQTELAKQYYLGDDSKLAGTAFLEAAERGLSPIHIAKESPWAVDVLTHSERPEQAKTIAEKAAEHGGPGHRIAYLNHLALADLAVAETQAIAVQKHFPIECPIVYFHVFLGRLRELHAGANNVSTALGEIRHRPSLSSEERLKAFARAETVVFPGGRSRYVATRRAPRNRLALAKVADTVAKGGVAKGDVLVAVNGTMVEDVYQYHFLRWELVAPTAIMTLWNPTRGYYQYPCTFKTWDKGTTFQILPLKTVVEVRIAAATSTLDLSGLGLREIPETVYHLTTLKGLDLSDNPLGTIPETIGALKNLEVLKLANCGLDALPDALAKLTSLKRLDLNENRFSSCPSVIERIPTLATLNLRDNALVRIGDGLCKKTSLTTLLLSGNAIADVPKEISQLTELVSLDLGKNVLSSFPEAVCALPKLKNLLLYDNDLSSVSAAIGDMAALSRLDVRHNLLTDLPETLAKAKELQILHMGGNLFLSVPKVVFDLAKLRDLDLGRNQLAELPSALSDMAALRRLIVSENLLDTLPPYLAKMPNLRAVYYGGNRIPAQVVAALMKNGASVKFSAVTYE